MSPAVGWREGVRRIEEHLLEWFYWLLPWGNIPLFVVFILLKFYLTLEVAAPIEIEVGYVFWKVLDVP